MNYRRAISADHDALMRLILEFEKEEVEYIDGVLTPEYLKNVKEAVGSDIESNNYFVIVNDGELVGFCLVERDLRNAKLARIIKLFINAKFRSKGLGSKLMDFVENSLKKSGISKIWLLAHLKNSANEFYKKRNYLVTDHEWVKWDKEL